MFAAVLPFILERTLLSFGLSNLVTAWFLYTPSLFYPVVIFTGADKIVHAGLFTFLTFFSLPFLRRFGFLKALGELWAYAFLSEVIQENFIPGRCFEWLDFLADGVGIGLAAYVFDRLVRRREN